MSEASHIGRAWERLGRLARRPWRSLSFQLSFPVGVVIFLAVGLAAYFNIMQHRQQLTQAVVAEGATFADTLRRVTFLSMMGGQRGHLYQAIEDVARRPGVERVRIMNAEGRVIFSTRPAETGSLVDKKAEACFACHAQDQPLARLPSQDRHRIFTKGGQRVLGTILPIYNQASCSGAACHAHPPAQKVLGVLDVDLSLAGLDQRLRAEMGRTLWFALALFLGISTIIGLSVIFAVSRTVRRMSREVDKLARGQEHFVTPVPAPAELGVLSRSIADMAGRVVRRTEALNRRYRQLVSNAPDAILLMEDDGRLRLANPEAQRVLGKPGKELAGADLTSLLVKEDRPVLRRALAEALGSRGESELIQVRSRCAKGLECILEGRVRRVEDPEGGPAAGLVGNFLDISDKSALEEQVAKSAALAAVGATLTGLAPYIKNLLQGLGNASYLVQEGLDANDSELLKKGWGMVNTSVGRVSQMAQDLLYFADYRLGELRPFDLNHLLADVSSLLSERAAGQGVELQTRPSPAGQAVLLDHVALKRALMNLGANALDALAEAPPTQGGRVVLECAPGGRNQVTISVEDNGPGVPGEVGERLFQSLVSTKGSRGTGMGLLICQKIVEEHGGYVSYSCPLGGGARFTLVLPVRSCVPEPQEPPRPTA
ncbi:MAG: PAS domain S-box protein [Desulfarculaceae bacterium]|nr:PAS domain S-box protein [Desulfarculaceae bacterium]